MKRRNDPWVMSGAMLVNAAFGLFLQTAVFAQSGPKIVASYADEGEGYFLIDEFNNRKLAIVRELEKGSFEAYQLEFDGQTFRTAADGIGKISREEFQKTSAQYEKLFGEALDFGISHNPAGEGFVLWKQLASHEVYLKKDEVGISSRIHFDNEAVEFDHQFPVSIQTVQLNGKRYILVLLASCGASACSAEIDALNEL